MCRRLSVPGTAVRTPVIPALTSVQCREGAEVGCESCCRKAARVLSAHGEQPVKLPGESVI